MGSLQECRIEGFICRLCSQIDRNVIHIYTEEGLQKKLEQKINVYLKINLTRYDPLPKTICLPCDVKLEQHHRFIQRVIQNQKKIEGGHPPGVRPIIPLLEQHLRVRVSPVVRDDGSGSNTYNIEAISSSESDSSDSDDSEEQPANPLLQNSFSLEALNNEENNGGEDLSDTDAPFPNNSMSSSSSTSSNHSMNNDEPLVGFSPNLEPVNASWNSSGSSSSNSTIDGAVIQADRDQDTI